MKHTIVTLLLSCMAMALMAQTTFSFQGKKKTTGKYCLLVNDTRTSLQDFTFATPAEALRYAEKKAENDTLWTEIYIMPSVYWMDNPDDEAVRYPEPGEGTPYAMTVKAHHIRMIGMGKQAEDVVLACNRGQTQGAYGNFTLFHFLGSHVQAQHITFGNYCNVDLVYPLNPRKNRSKRKNAIVQAQIAICNGDYYQLTDCRFISRLNLCPFVGAKHTTFDNCYFECTDDALCGTGIYRHCHFTLYSSKPFYSTDKEQGAVLIDCDIHSKTQGTQYLTKASGPIELVRCRWTSDDKNLKIWWTKRADPKHRCVMKDCTLNGKPLEVPQPTEALPLILPPFPLSVQTEIVPGGWTIDCHKPTDTMAHNWQADNSHSAWGWAEGVDGAEGKWGLVQLQKGARLMYTPRHEGEPCTSQTCTVTLYPCKGAGQGFGSATGQYLDLCIKFNTRTLTGYGLRIVRTPDHDHAVEAVIVEYLQGEIKPISQPQVCRIYKGECSITLTAHDSTFSALIENPSMNVSQTLTAIMPHPNPFAGFHLQHTGSTGPSGTVVGAIKMKN